MTDPTQNTLPKTARIVSPLTGALIGGIVAKHHTDGTVSILFGGLRKRGSPVSLQEVLEIERKGAVT